MTDILFAVGTRPNLIKLKPLYDAAVVAGLKVNINDSNQHYEPGMQNRFYKEFNIPTPTVCSLNPDHTIVVVIGDTNSAVDHALCYSRQGYRIAHVEAGCRCGKNIPEEINRKAVDAIATWNFAPTSSCLEALRGITAWLTGDVLYDLFLKYKPPDLGESFGSPTNLSLLTVHRQENDNHERLSDILNREVSPNTTAILPVHPRIRERLKWVHVPENIILTEPVGYRTILNLLYAVDHVYTDSGGLQREAYWAGVPFTLLRNETEWPETLTPGNEKEFGDGHAAEKIIDILKKELRE